MSRVDFADNLRAEIEDDASSIHVDDAYSNYLHVSPKSAPQPSFGRSPALSASQLGSSRLSDESLPEQIAKLMVANETYKSSLQQAHNDLKSMLAEREEISDALRTADQHLAEAAEMTSSWMKTDVEWMKQRKLHLKQQITETRTMRERLSQKLRSVGIELS